MGCGGGFGGTGVYKHYGAFSDTTTQTASVTTAAYPMRLNTTEIADGVSVVSGSRITVDNTGIYNLQFSAQLDKVAGGASPVDIDIWLAYTGSNVPRSNTTITIQGSQPKVVAAWNFVLPIAANDYVQLLWKTSDVDGVLFYQNSSSSPTRPEVPSVIVTLQQI